MQVIVRAAIILLTTLLMLAPASAVEWPTRPVKIIVSQAAGGTPDIICRLISDRLSKALGQQFVVENRPGAANVVGAIAAARAAADGYTLFFAPAAALASNPHTFKSLSYDPLKDYVVVAMVAKTPFLVLVNSTVPIHSLAEMVAYDKANPGKLSIATDGPRFFSGMLATWLNKVSGAHVLQVPYATMPKGIQDTLAGRTQIAILAIPAAAPYITSGMLKPIAISWPTRLPLYPDVPTLAESYPGVEVTGWFAIVAPTGTPVDIVARLNQETDKILKAPEVANRLADLAFFTEGAETPDTARTFVNAQYELWGKVVREIGLEPE